MSRPTSKKESKELLKFFNSVTRSDYHIPEDFQENETWELLISCSIIYFFGMTFIFYKLLGY
jgi:hypothetical protein